MRVNQRAESLLLNTTGSVIEKNNWDSHGPETKCMISALIKTETNDFLQLPQTPLNITLTQIEIGWHSHLPLHQPLEFVFAETFARRPPLLDRPRQFFKPPPIIVQSGLELLIILDLGSVDLVYHRGIQRDTMCDYRSVD